MVQRTLIYNEPDLSVVDDVVRYLGKHINQFQKPSDNLEFLATRYISDFRDALGAATGELYIVTADAFRLERTDSTTKLKRRALITNPNELRDDTMRHSHYGFVEILKAVADYEDNVGANFDFDIKGSDKSRILVVSFKPKQIRSYVQEPPSLETELLTSRVYEVLPRTDNRGQYNLTGVMDSLTKLIKSSSR